MTVLLGQHIVVQHRTSGPICIKNFRSADLSLTNLPLQSAVSVFFHVNKPLNLDNTFFFSWKAWWYEPRSFFSPWVTVCKGWHFVWIPEKLFWGGGTQLSYRPKGSFVHSYTTTSRTTVVFCALWTPAMCGYLYRIWGQWQHVWEKWKSTFTLQAPTTVRQGPASS